MWQGGRSFSPLFVPPSFPSDKSSCPDFKEIPERHFCCYISRPAASTNQENGFQVQTTTLSPASLENRMIVSSFNLEMDDRGNRRVTLGLKTP
jgi:hypothetical protein